MSPEGCDCCGVLLRTYWPRLAVAAEAAGARDWRGLRELRLAVLLLLLS